MVVLKNWLSKLLKTGLLLCSVLRTVLKLHTDGCLPSTFGFSGLISSRSVPVGAASYWPVCLVCLPTRILQCLTLSLSRVIAMFENCLNASLSQKHL